MDNNVVLIIAVIVVVVLFFYYNQAKQPRNGNGDGNGDLYVPDEESNIPPLPDYHPMVNSVLTQTEARFHAAYKECMAGCGQQGRNVQECASMCKQVFARACDTIDTECSAEMSNMADSCVTNCVNRGYSADQCTAYCNNAMTYLCDEMDEACQAGVTPVI